MLHLAAISASIANTAADLAIAGVNTTQDPTRDSNLIVPAKMPKLLMAFAFGTNLTRAYLQPPSLRNSGNIEIEPLANATPVAYGVWPIMDFLHNPIPLEPGEELPAFGRQGSGGAQVERIFVLFGDKAPSAIVAKAIPIRLTGTTTLTADAWSLVTLTPDQTLPRGTYIIIGFRARSTGAVAARLSHPDYPNRPGLPAFQNQQASNHDILRHGRFGEMMRFTEQQLPQVEFWSTSADTAETVELDVIVA